MLSLWMQVLFALLLVNLALATPFLLQQECNGNGDIFVGTTSCYCHQGYTGPNCETSVPDCALDLNGGNPLMFQDYWKTHPLNVDIPADWRLGYASSYQHSPPPHDSLENLHLEGLELSIRNLHSFVGNVKNISDYHVVVGTGSTSLILAALRSLAASEVSARQPYYNYYKTAATFVSPANVSFVAPEDVTSESDLVEFITSPNNPDGHLRHPLWPKATHVWDLAYHWPHFIPVTEPMDEDIMLFTLSKLTGHAGSRVGWALLKDADLAHKMGEYMSTVSLGVSLESQLRAQFLLTSIVERQGAPLLAAEKLMQSRWAELEAAFANQSRPHRFEIQTRESERFCRFFGDTRKPSPPYLWIKCLPVNGVETSCSTVFTDAGLMGRPGPLFGADDTYFRLSLLARQSTFDLMMPRLRSILASPSSPREHTD